MEPRLGIVVPYRDRRAHLDMLLPHLRRYFSEDEARRRIPMRIMVVEQAAGAPFNRGAIKNIGFLALAEEVEYVCFHDVDYLPIRADYSHPDQPVMIITEGVDLPPEIIRILFGGVVLLRTAHAAAANGYPNDYIGWGFEDVDLRQRLIECGLRPGHRRGAFTRLPHLDEGSGPDGAPTEAHTRNQRQYIGRWFENPGSGWRRRAEPSGAWRRNGLNSVAYEVLSPRRRIDIAGAEELVAEHMTVALI